MRHRRLRASLVILSPAVAHAQEARPSLSRFRVGAEIRVGHDLPDLPHVEPTLAINPSDPAHMVAAALVVRDPHSDRFWDSWTVHVLVSTDAGATWTRRRWPGLDAAVAGDPWLAWAPDGTLYLSCLAAVEDEQGRRPFKVRLYSSTDGGHSWSDAIQVPFAERGSQDHPVLALTDGAVHLFASGDLPSIVVSRRQTDAAAFEPLPAFRPDARNNNLGSGVAFGDGRFVFSYFSMSVPQPSTLWAIRSADGGRTYQRAPITSEHIPVGFPMMTRDGDRVYSVWSRSDERPDIMLSRSDDFGATWSAPVRVQADSSLTHRTLPVATVNRDGVVGVIWIDGRHHRGSCWDVYATVSLDGGETFLPEVRLTVETTCPSAAGNGGTGRRWPWGGDYIGMATDGAGAFYPIWSDSRTGTYQIWMTRFEAP